MKYLYMEKLKDIHHPGSISLYQIGLFKPELKTRYIRDESFEKELSYGYPFFEEQSAVVTPIHYPNPELTREITDLFKSFDWSLYNKEVAIEKTDTILDRYEQSQSVFSKIESDEEMEERLKYEIVESKMILKRNCRELDFLCWPHGDNDQRSHKMALDIGFKANTLGSKVFSDDWSDRIPPRFSNALFKGSVKLGIMKMDMKMRQYQGQKVGALMTKLYQIINRQ